MEQSGAKIVRRKSGRSNTYHQFVGGFTRYLRSKDIRSTDLYLGTLDEFLSWCDQQEASPLSANGTFIKSWRADQIKAALNHGTINNKTSRLRHFYAHLKADGRILSNPFDGLSFLRAPKGLPKNVLSVNEVDSLLEAFPVATHDQGYLKTVLEILYGSALRISEVVSLTEADIDYERGGFRIIEHKKGGSRRWVPATEASFKAILCYKRAHRPHLLQQQQIEAGLLFPPEAAATLRQRFNRALGSTCRRLELKLITSHSLRHSAATHLLSAGAGIRQVQEFLGHSKIASTERYTRVLKDDLKSVVDTLHPRSSRLQPVGSPIRGSL